MPCNCQHPCGFFDRVARAQATDVVVLPDMICPATPREKPIYLLVEIRDRRDLVSIRRAINALDLNVAHVPVHPSGFLRSDKELTPVLYEQTKGLFEHHMGRSWRARHGR